MNFTKTIDFENCTGLNYDVYNKNVQGTNPDQDSVSIMFFALKFIVVEILSICLSIWNTSQH